MVNPEKDLIKLAFEKVKQDIDFLNNEILELKISINEFKLLLNNIKPPPKNTTTIRQLNSTKSVTSTDNTTDNTTVPQEIGGLKPLNLDSSIGNEGASTDRQTDRQTDNSTYKYTEDTQKSIESNIKQASEIFESLDVLKKEIRLKFKHLTSQEMLVFSTIYQLEEQNYNQITYKQLSKHLKLSESSIRDYIQRMTNKGISIKKHKINNKQIQLSISSELKKIASLSTIIQLREL